MGYTTDFFGHFTLNKKLDTHLHNYLNKFADTRRMKRHVAKIPGLITRVIRAFYQTEFGGYGTEGEFFVEGSGCMGQDADPSVIDNNEPPTTQPGLWCQWRPSEDGLKIEWDGNEKFYNYVEWLQYICDKLLAPRGYVLNGRVRYQGEDYEDLGWVVCNNNHVSNVRGRVVSEEEVRPVEPTKPRKPRAKKPKATTPAKRVIDWQ